MRSDATPSDAPVRWGVLSAANIGVKFVIPAIRASSNGRLVALASRNPQRAQEVFAQLPELRIYDDYESLVNDPDIEAIYNPLPNSLHAEWTIKALQARKHVLCEKPLAVTAAQGKTMIDTARANGVLLMEAFMYRFHPQTIWALEQIHAGRIGPVRLVHSSFSFNLLHPPRPHDIRLQASLAGGSLMDVGCYAVNFCRAVYGHAPIAVGARVYAPGMDEVERSANAVLDFGEGQFGLIDSSFELPRRQIVEAIGERGTLTIHVPFTPGTAETIVTVALEDQTISQRIPGVDQYRLEVEHFAACVRSGTPPALRLEESLENLATIEAIYTSAGYPWPMDVLG
jgi:D-xylose 1-dehydrogenase (NADP+, D-xylono-1,5-lactone-forming)